MYAILTKMLKDRILLYKLSLDLYMYLIYEREKEKENRKINFYEFTLIIRDFSLYVTRTHSSMLHYQVRIFSIWSVRNIEISDFSEEIERILKI